MQRFLLLVITLFALYACANIPPPLPVETTMPPSEESAELPASAVPAIEAPELPETTEVTPPELPPPDGLAGPHIALLLPLKSPAYGQIAGIVQQGFMAANNLQRRVLPVRVYSDFDENTEIVTAYHQAIANGARAVVGPLTRNGVAMLAAEKYIPVPTLALNVVDVQPAPQFYFFGMAAETEARRVAQLAKQKGLEHAIIITSKTQLSQRLQNAFEEEWHFAGGSILREIEFNGHTDVLSDITESPDTMVFLAADAGKARLVRPYLSIKMPVYSTSLIFNGNDKTLTNYDLNGIHFVDEPWLLQPDHPAVMIYPRSSTPLTADRDRFYALGIDAFRLTQLLLTNRIPKALPLDGVSGKIQLYGHVFMREPMEAVFLQGMAQLPSAINSVVPEGFPTKTITVP